MGIQIMNKDGNVQLMHVADLAINAQYSEEGLVFMKEMIQLNEEASYPPEQEDAFRFVSILANEMPTLLAGPAQFGNNFKKGPLVGSIAKSKIMGILVPSNAIKKPSFKQFAISTSLGRTTFLGGIWRCEYEDYI